MVDLAGSDGTGARSVLANGEMIVDRRRDTASPTRRSDADTPDRRRVVRHLHLVPPLADDSTSAPETPAVVPPESVVPSSAGAIRARFVTKRLFDITVALLLAVVTLPVLVVLLAGSLIAYRTNPIFVQRRVGQHGREFLFVKVRSLPPTTPTYADKYQLAAVTNNRWGRLLRRFKLDELPQLWHVVFGRMSLVGPRPEMPALSRSFEPAFVARRLQVKPGCSGLWQISPDNARLIGEAPQWDLHYVSRWTLRLDLWVLAVTIASIPGWTSVDRLEDIPAWTGATDRRNRCGRHDAAAVGQTAATESGRREIAGARG